MESFHGAVIAGTHSGTGKTTWSLALMNFFKRKGWEVQPFKVGPDYIDTGLHHAACSPRKSRNLDRFFLSEDYVRQSFAGHSSGARMALIEGVMGLYDGRNNFSEEGSTAEAAKLLGLPAFLVVDGAGLARSAAALVKGYQSFDPALNLRGVLLNRISSEGHLRWLKEPIEKETGLPVLGWLPEDAGVGIPERHLGLRTALEEHSLHEKLHRLGKLLEGKFEEERFLELSQAALPTPILVPGPELQSRRREGVLPRCRIGIAYDKAFSFYYEDNFDLLREAGAELVFFSPLKDSRLPGGLEALYLGGGFPEIYAEELSRNESMKSSLQEFYQAGGLVYAECGGLIYLARSFEGPDGQSLPMAGLVPGRVRMKSRLQNFGYHEIESQLSTFLFPAGRKLRSHEFHYSEWEGAPEPTAPYQIRERREGYYDGRILASYQHLHFGQDRELARNFVLAAAERAHASCR